MKCDLEMPRIEEFNAIVDFLIYEDWIVVLSFKLKEITVRIYTIPLKILLDFTGYI